MSTATAISMPWWVICYVVTAPDLGSGVTMAMGISPPALSSMCWPDWVSVADVNHDHIADLVIGSSLYHHLYVYQDIGGTYTHTFAFDQGDWGQWRDQVWLGDLNNDTQPDMVWAGYTSDVFYGDGTGAFTHTLMNDIHSPLAVGDLNEDGWPDILSRGKFWLNDGTGGFQTWTEPIAKADRSALGDLNGDQHLDALVGTYVLGVLYVGPAAVYYNGRCWRGRVSGADLQLHSRRTVVAAGRQRRARPTPDGHGRPRHVVFRARAAQPDGSRPALHRACTMATTRKCWADCWPIRPCATEARSALLLWQPNLQALLTGLGPNRRHHRRAGAGHPNISGPSVCCRQSGPAARHRRRAREPATQ